MNRTLAAMLLIGATAFSLSACTESPDLLVDQQVIEEDEPGYDCNTMGNRICGDPTGEYAPQAWAAWDSGEGWRRLRAASTDTRVLYVGTSSSDVSPNVNALNEVAVPSSSGWYVFRAEPCTPDTCDPDEGEDIPAEELAAITATNALD